MRLMPLLGLLFMGLFLTACLPGMHIAIPRLGVALDVPEGWTVHRRMAGKKMVMIAVRNFKERQVFIIMKTPRPPGVTLKKLAADRALMLSLQLNLPHRRISKNPSSFLGRPSYHLAFKAGQFILEERLFLRGKWFFLIRSTSPRKSSQKELFLIKSSLRFTGRKQLSP